MSITPHRINFFISDELEAWVRTDNSSLSYIAAGQFDEEPKDSNCDLDNDDDFDNGEELIDSDDYDNKKVGKADKKYKLLDISSVDEDLKFVDYEYNPQDYHDNYFSAGKYNPYILMLSFDGSPYMLEYGSKLKRLQLPVEKIKSWFWDSKAKSRDGYNLTVKMYVLSSDNDLCSFLTIEGNPHKTINDVTLIATNVNSFTSVDFMYRYSSQTSKMIVHVTNDGDICRSNNFLKKIDMTKFIKFSGEMVIMTDHIMIMKTNTNTKDIQFREIKNIGNIVDAMLLGNSIYLINSDGTTSTVDLSDGTIVQNEFNVDIWAARFVHVRKHSSRIEDKDGNLYKIRSVRMLDGKYCMMIEKLVLPFKLIGYKQNHQMKRALN